MCGPYFYLFLTLCLWSIDDVGNSQIPPNFMRNVSMCKEACDPQKSNNLSEGGSFW